MKAPDPLLRTKDPELWDWIDRVNLILNSGKYEFFITNVIPTERANNGEQKIYASDDSSIRRFYVYIQGVWCLINFDTGGNVTTGGFGDHIIDANGDTLVHTDYNHVNEDIVRTYSRGVYVMAVDTYGLQIAPAYKVVFDGLAGDTYWTYSSASTYMQCYLNGTLRMEM